MIQPLASRLRSRPVLISLTVLLAVASALGVRQLVLRIGTVALVNGERISAAPINKRIERLKIQTPARFAVDPGRRKELALRKDMVEARVRLRLISQAARAAGITVAEKEIDQELARQARGYKSKSKFYEAMEAEGYSARILREDTRDFLAELKMRRKLAKEAIVGEGEIDSYIAAKKEKLESETNQVRLTEVKVAGREQADQLGGGKGDGRVAAKAKELGLPVESYWHQHDLLAFELRDAILQTGAGGILYRFPTPDNTVSLFEVHEWRGRRSGADELRSQVKRKLLWDKQASSFGRWLATIQASAGVRIFD